MQGILSAMPHVVNHIDGDKYRYSNKLHVALALHILLNEMEAKEE